MVSARRFEQLALAFEGTYAVPHMERTAYRTKRRIFATVAADGQSANLLLDADLQDTVCGAMPQAFSPVPGGWGRMGYTTVKLAGVSETELVEVLREAHARATEPPKKKRRAR